MIDLGCLWLLIISNNNNKPESTTFSVKIRHHVIAIYMSRVNILHTSSIFCDLSYIHYYFIIKNNACRILILHLVFFNDVSSLFSSDYLLVKLYIMYVAVFIVKN